MPTSKKVKKPLILTLLDSPAYGGAEQYMLSNCSALSGKGYPVFVATNNDAVRKQASLLIDDKKLSFFRVEKFPFVLDAIGNWKGLLKFFFYAPWAVGWFILTVLSLKGSHDQIICYLAGFSDRLLLSPIAKMLGCKVIWVEIGPLEPTFKKNWGFPQLFHAASRPFADTFITTSHWTTQSMIRAGKIAKEKITLIYPGVILPKTKEIRQYKKLGEHWRKKHHYEKTFIISFIGRMALENEVDVLIKALSLFHNNFHKDVLGVFIGDGPEKKYFLSIAKRLKIETKILFTGFVSQKEKLSLVATSDVFVFSRAWELDGFGMTTIEGMSVQTPVITSDFGPQQEIIQDGDNGLRFSPHSPKDLAEKIGKYWKNENLRQKLAIRGNKSISPKFSEEYMHTLTLKVVENLT